MSSIISIIITYPDNTLGAKATVWRLPPKDPLKTDLDPRSHSTSGHHLILFPTADSPKPLPHTSPFSRPETAHSIAARIAHSSVPPILFNLQIADLMLELHDLLKRLLHRRLIL